jgi:hypothetical protein
MNMFRELGVNEKHMEAYALKIANALMSMGIANLHFTPGGMQVDADIIKEPDFVRTIEEVFDVDMPARLAFFNALNNMVERAACAMLTPAARTASGAALGRRARTAGAGRWEARGD